MNGLLHFEDALPALSATEKRVASYFSDHAASLTAKPILEVANDCATSKSTVVRVCKHLGFAGYKDFLQYMSATMALQGDSEQMQNSADMSAVCSLVIKQAIHTLHHTLRTIDVETLTTIVDLLFSASRLFFFGMGDYLMVAQDAALKFSRIGHPAHAADSRYCQVLDASTMESGDLAFFFYDSQNIQDVQPLLSSIQGCKACSIVITDCETIQGTYTLVIPHRQEPGGNLRIAMLGIIDMLFSSLTSTHAAYYAAILQRTANAIKQERTCT